MQRTLTKSRLGASSATATIWTATPGAADFLGTHEELVIGTGSAGAGGAGAGVGSLVGGGDAAGAVLS